MSLEFAKVFNFLQGNSSIHRLDPRVKGLMVIVYSTLAFLFHDLSIMCFLVLCTVPLLYLANMTQDFFKGLGNMSFLFFFIIIINTFSQPLNYSLVVCLRIVVIMMTFSVFFQTTLPDDLMQALMKMHVSYPTAFSLALAFRFVPTMASETEIITEAQKSRGHRIEEGGIWQQIRNIFPLIIPLMMNSIRRAYNVAEALEARGFGGYPTRTNYYPLKMKTSDYIFIFLNLVFFGVGLFISFNINSLFPVLIWNLTI